MNYYILNYVGSWAIFCNFKRQITFIPYPLLLFQYALPIQQFYCKKFYYFQALQRNLRNPNIDKQYKPRKTLSQTKFKNNIFTFYSDKYYTQFITNFSFNSNFSTFYYSKNDKKYYWICTNNMTIIVNL